MKKTFFTMAMVLLVAGTVCAQYYTPPPRHIDTRYTGDDFYKPQLGLDIGANIANTVNAYNANYSTNTLTGFHAGLTLSIPLIYPLSIDAEAVYSQKGYTATTTSGNFTDREQFIDVPLLLKFNVGPVMRLYVGPQYSFLLNTQNTYDNGFALTSQQFYNNGSSTAILDGVAGVGFDLSKYVELRGRYTLDLKSTSSVNSVYQPNYRNQVWQVGLNFKF